LPFSRFGFASFQAELPKNLQTAIEVVAKTREKDSAGARQLTAE